MRRLHKGLLTIGLLTASALVTSAQAACAFGAGTLGEPSLQQGFDLLQGAGAINTATDCVADGQDAHWSADQAASATMAFEFAGNASKNVFGIYDLSDPSYRLPLFYGHDASLAHVTLGVSSLANGLYQFTTNKDGTTESARFASSNFGFYLRTPDGVFYSDSTLNTGGEDHLFVYSGTGGIFQSGDRFGAAAFYLAWEDSAPRNDGDYQDMVIGINNFRLAGASAAPVPLPAPALLLGSGLAWLGAFAKRRRNRTGDCA